MKRACVKMQSFVRMAVSRKRFVRFKKALCDVQNVMRMLIAREIIAEKDEVLFKEAKAKATAARLAEMKAKLEQESAERERLRRLEEEREAKAQADLATQEGRPTDPVPSVPSPVPSAPTPLHERKRSVITVPSGERKRSVAGLGSVRPSASNQKLSAASSNEGLLNDIEKSLQEMMVEETDDTVNIDDWFEFDSLQDDILKELEELEKKAEETEQEALLAEERERERQSDVFNFIPQKFQTMKHSASVATINSDGGTSDFSFVKYGNYHFPKNGGPFFSKVSSAIWFCFLESHQRDLIA